MILDFEYKNRKLIVSEIDEHGEIKFNYYPWGRPKKFVPCEDFDDNKHPQYTTWDKKPVKLEYTNMPNRFSVYEFLDRLNDEEQERLWKLQQPKTFFMDIETEILPTGFVEPTDATTRVLTVAIVHNEKIWVLGIKPLSQKKIDKIKDDIESHFSKFGLEFQFKYMGFDQRDNPEKAMLDYLFTKLIPKMPVITGWNFLAYDWTFLINRCRRIGVDFTKSSPTGKIENIFGTPFEVPAHRLIVDYMEIYKKWDTRVKVKESNSLDWVSEKVLGDGVKKVSYTDEAGIYNLQDLYEKNFERYVFYNAVDTVLVQLIHEKMKYMDIIFSTSALAKIRMCDFAYKNLNTTLVVTEGFLRGDFREKKNIVFCKDKEELEVDGIAGGWVKNPRQGMNEWVATYDFASLYPHMQMQYNISPETFRGFQIGNNKEYADNNGELVKINPDDVICENGAVFSKDESVTIDFLKRVYGERKKYKKLMNEDIAKVKDLKEEIEKIEEELKLL